MKTTLSASFALKKSAKKNATLVLLVDENQIILSQELTKAQQNHLNGLINCANFKGKVGETLADYAFTQAENSLGYQDILLVGVGKTNQFTGNILTKIATSIYKTLSHRSTRISLVLDNIFDSRQFSQFALALLNASYSFHKYKSKALQTTLNSVCFVSQQDFNTQLKFVNAVFTGQSTARDLANEPGNVCFPTFMSEQAKQLAKDFADCLKVTIIGEKQMQKLGMNSFLAVSTGSEQEGQLILLEYTGKTSKTNNKGKKKKAKAADEQPIVLVGKGVTFDTGGISLKPAVGMEEMKFDMSGAASVFGTIRALCEAKLPINVVGALACAENMPAGNATRPGDIVTSMSGQTIEINNTDAEGRLVLCDTLTYVQKYNPKVIIDVATLTGACVIALGHVRAAVYSQDEDVLNDLQFASSQINDRIWHMPLDDDYQEQLDSPCADICNIGGRPAGSVTAACFLSRFVGDYPWAHLDIAGVSHKSGKEKGATGRPVPLFMQYLANASLQN